MKNVSEAVKTLDKIDEVKQVLYSADVDEGTYLTYDVVRMILDLLSDYAGHIYKMGVTDK